MRSYTVVGVGAVGGYYGARLAAAGHPVRWLASSDAQHLRSHGLRVESPSGDLDLSDLDVYDAPTSVPPSDVVLVALKTTANGVLAHVLPPLLGDGSAVLLLQNGLGIEDRVRPISGDRALLGGLCFVCVNKVGPGHVRHLDYGLVTIGQDGGDPARGPTPLAEELAADMRTAGLPASAEADLVLARWRKLVWNVPFNGLSVVLDALPQELLADRATRSLVEALMAEVKAGAAACGRSIDDAFIGQMVGDTEAMTPYLTSMKLDFDAGRPLEVEAIVGAPVRAARSAGAELVRMDVLYRQLCFLDRRKSAS